MDTKQKLSNLNILLNCPHCNECIEIIEINCAIFRHGVYKNNLQQINPHLSKKECDELIINNLIYGCGKPFQIKKIDNQLETCQSNKYKLVICDYI